jgi:hypothetical protein
MGSRIHQAAALLCLTVAGSSLAAPIYLRSGQCIIVGGQEVCALSEQTTQTVTKIFHRCDYGTHAGAEIPGLKSYAVIQIVMNTSGTKNETVLRNYGSTDAEKAACQQEVDRLNEPKK